MARTPKPILISVEPPELASIRASVGKEVPISSRYCRGPRPILMAIDGEVCRLRYPNGVEITNVPIRDLVDDRGYWK